MGFVSIVAGGDSPVALPRVCRPRDSV